MSVSIDRTRRPVRGAKSKRRVESLLVVAREVFAARGYEKATALEIAQRLGISEATVFSYFGSKRDLCLEVIRRWYEEISSELEGELPAIEGMRGKLHFVVRRHLSHLIGDGAGLCALILSEGRVADDAFKDAIGAMKRRYVKPLMAAIQNARQRGEMRSDVGANLLRDMVYGSMEHVLWDFVASGHKPDIDRTAEQLTDLLWRSFAPVNLATDVLSRFHSDVVAAVRRSESPSL